MANRLKGITLEIGGDTTDLSKSLKNVNSDIKSTQSQLKDVEKLLKLDPTNIELLRQKEKLLNDEVKQTTSKLEELKKAQKTMDDNGVDKNSEQYMALQREIISTENELKNLKTAASESNATMSQIAAVADSVAEKANKVASATKGLSTAAAAGLASIAGLAYSSVTSADDLNTLAKQTGFTTAELQKMEYASDLVDVSMDDITSAATKLKKNMSSDSDSVVSAFEQLGVSVTNADGSMRDSTETFWNVISALSEVTNETERDELAMTLLGRGADSLAGIIDDGAAAFNELGDEAEQAGLIMSQDTLDSLNDVNDEIDKLKANAKAVLAESGAKAMEALQPVLEKLLAVITDILNAIGNMSTEQIEMIVIILAIVAAISPIASIIAGIASAVSALIPIVTALNAAVLANPVIAIIALITILIVALTVLIIKNWDQIKAAFLSLKQTIVDGANEFKDAWIDAWDKIFTKFKSIGSSIASAFKSLVNSIIQLVENGLNAVISKINAVISAFNSVVSVVASAIGVTYSGIKTIKSVSLPKLATGGTVLNGSAIVGEAGPELLTVANGHTTVTPLTATIDNKSLSALAGNQGGQQTININFTGSLSQLARILQPEIVTETARRGSNLIAG